MMIIFKNEEFLDIEETAKLLNCATTTVRMRTRAKEMPTPMRLTSRVFWKKKEIDAYLESTRKKDLLLTKEELEELANTPLSDCLKVEDTYESTRKKGED